MGSKLSSAAAGRLSPRTRTIVHERRQKYLVASFLIPLLTGIATLALDHDKICSGTSWSSNKCKGNFMLLSAASFMIPSTVSFLAACSLDLIRSVSSRPANKPSAPLALVFFLASIVMSVFVAIVDPSPFLGLLISCSFIAWGWLVEAAIGLATPIGLVASSNCLAIGFAKALVKDHEFNPVYWCSLIPPVALASTLNMLTWTGYQRRRLPPDSEVEMTPIAAV